jgi:putative toxin-antitoxin system antitoxin component (TIGR02293 family)
MTDENPFPGVDPAISIKAVEVFGSKEEVEQWLHSPAMGLNGRRPIDLLESPEGKRLVKEFLSRLEFGVYQ